MPCVSNGNVTRGKHFAIKSRAEWRGCCFAPEQFNLATHERCSLAPAGSGRIKGEDDPMPDILQSLLVKTTTSLDQAMHGNVADKRSLLELGVWMCVWVHREGICLMALQGHDIIEIASLCWAGAVSAVWMISPRRGQMECDIPSLGNAWHYPKSMQCQQALIAFG